MKRLYIAGLPFLLCALLGNSSWAAWETITQPRNPDRNCEESHDRNRFALLKNSDNRPLRVLAGASGDIEIYGHLLDAVTDVNMGGISGASARRAGGHAGAVNGARRCGAIGSIIVNISVPSSTTASNGGTLHVGGEDIPILVVRGDPRVDWSPYNDSDLLSSETQAQIDANRNRAQQQAQAERQANQAQCEAEIAQCEANRAQRRAQAEAERQRFADECRRSNSNCLIIPAQPGTATSCSQVSPSCQTRNVPRPDPALEGPSRCLRDLGGSVNLIQGNRLEVILPELSRANGSPLMNCLGRKFLVEQSRATQGGIPDFAKNAPSIGRASLSRNSGDNAFSVSLFSNGSDDFFGMGLNSTFIRDFAGFSSGESFINLGGRPAAGSLKWSIVTNPMNGVKKISPLVFSTRTQAGPVNASIELHNLIRTSSTSNLRQPSLTNSRSSIGSISTPTGNVSWQITATGTKTVESCFKKASGSTNVLNNQKTASFNLEPTEASGCNQATFQLKAWLTGFKADVGVPFVAETPVKLGKLLSRVNTPVNSPSPVTSSPIQR